MRFQLISFTFVPCAENPGLSDTMINWRTLLVRLNGTLRPVVACIGVAFQQVDATVVMCFSLFEGRALDSNSLF